MIPLLLKHAHKANPARYLSFDIDDALTLTEQAETKVTPHSVQVGALANAFTDCRFAVHCAFWLITELPSGSNSNLLRSTATAGQQSSFPQTSRFAFDKG